MGTWVPFDILNEYVVNDKSMITMIQLVVMIKLRKLRNIIDSLANFFEKNVVNR